MYLYRPVYLKNYIGNLLARLRVSINIPSENADTSNEKEDANNRRGDD